uniref:Uncharacterized protein n=1 Tax=Mastacembelus armatus TaxID=205130 RepID=A0A3Q3L117_9TELE
SSSPFLEDPSLVFALSLFTWDSAMSARSSASSSSCWSLRSLAMLLILELFDASLQFLELLLAALHGNLFSLIQTVLQVFDGLLHVLFHALQVGTGVLLLLQLLSHHGCGLVPAPGLRLQRRLKGLEHPLVVSLSLLHFLIFLGQFSLHVSLHLVELQLSSEGLALFMFQRTFCLL